MLLTPDGNIYIKLNQKGSFEGKPWDDGPGGQVKYICVCHGDIIYSIQTAYDRQGTDVVSHRHGGDDGNFEMVSFSLNEPLTWVSGYYGSYCLEPEIFADEEEAPYNYCKVITSLKFGTDRSTYGPFGREVGEPFQFKSTTRISGFLGRSSDVFLHAIGVYVSTLASQVIGGPSLPIVNNFKSVEGIGNDCKSVETSE